MAKYPSEQAERFQIRLPDGLRDRIKADARANGRSMNAEILARLEAGSETLRDKFAWQAIPAFAAELYQQSRDRRVVYENVYTLIAAAAYELADAMLAAREAQP